MVYRDRVVELRNPKVLRCESSGLLRDQRVLRG
jgi:hypothetical protein